MCAYRLSLVTASSDVQNLLGKLPEKKNAASDAVSFLVKGTPERLGYLVYLIIVGKSELLKN